MRTYVIVLALCNQDASAATRHYSVQRAASLDNAIRNAKSDARKALPDARPYVVSARWARDPSIPVAGYVAALAAEFGPEGKPCNVPDAARAATVARAMAAGSSMTPAEAFAAARRVLGL